MDAQISPVLFAFALSLAAGLSTGIGGLIAISGKQLSRKMFSAAMGFSAGVMIYISFVELLDDAFLELAPFEYGKWYVLAAFFGGIALIAIIDKLVPEEENPHEMLGIDKVIEDDLVCEARNKKKMMRTGIFAAVVIAIHNFPEGMASFFSALSNPTLGISIAFAIAIHNIPEGISIAVPLRYADGSKKKAFGVALLSGLSEPIGAIIGYAILAPFITETILAIIFAVVAGIMVYISVDELIPAAEASGEHHHSIFGFVAGMAVMAVSLFMFQA
ncbi:MAG: zinc transporter ZupT [Coriobacteriia bacterium]|nr:zinc transporter ZupT [Coriobacteriia bacterium]